MNDELNFRGHPSVPLTGVTLCVDTVSFGELDWELIQCVDSCIGTGAFFLS